MTDVHRPKELDELLALLGDLGSAGNDLRMAEFRLQLHRIVRKRLRPQDRLRQFFDSEDLTQEVWMRIAKRAHQFQGETWNDFFRFVEGLVGQGQNDLARHYRSQKRGAGQPVGEIDSNAIAADDRSPASMLVQSEKVEQVRQRMRALPDKYRIPLELKVFEGLDGPAIAKQLDLTPDAARQRISRALGMLAEGMQQDS